MGEGLLVSTAAVIDLRSDTVTKPTPEMREAMFNAEVGDDVYQDDPTVNKLEKRAAEILGKEAGLFVPSGTMGNLISILCHCRSRGDEYIIGNEAHIYFYEQGGASQLGGAHPRVIPTNKDGTLNLKDIEEAIRGDDVHFPITRVICLENTHNRCGGRVLPTSYIDSVGEISKKHGLKLHVDGARLMNAAVALNEDPARLVKAADSVSLCLSKGLGAPVGSIIVGTKEFIHNARRLRKALGGGMRQAGVIAAPALIALEEMPKRLHIDHANAKRLAKGITELSSFGVTTDVETVETNIVFLDILRDDITAVTLCQKLREKGLWLSAFSNRKIRLTLHHHISSDNVDRALQIISSVLKEWPSN